MRRRKSIPLATQLAVALRQLFGTDAAELDHDPALGLRDYDEATGLYTPDELDPDHLIWRRKADHHVKTFGEPATTAGSDVHRIAQLERITEKQEAFRRRLLAKDAGEPPPPSRWRKNHHVRRPVGS